MIYLALPLVVFILGLFMLRKGSDVFVESAARIAKHLGISEFIIGLTLIAVGTSLPELGASLMASYSNNPEIVIGNVLGSNIANIGLILGISSMITVLSIEPAVFRRDTVILLGVSLLAYFFALDSWISGMEGIVLIMVFLFYIAFLFRVKPHVQDIYKFGDYMDHLFHLTELLDLKTYRLIAEKGVSPATYEQLIHTGIDIGITPFRIARAGIDYHTYQRIIEEYGSKLKAGILREVTILLVGLAFILLGAKFLIDGAVDLASILRIPKGIIALTIISIGTSLPELAVAISSARKGFGNMILGNIIGSNIANLALVLGLSAFLVQVPISPLTLSYILPFMLLSTVLCVLFIRSWWMVRMFEGLIFLLLYLGFIIWIFYQITPV